MAKKKTLALDVSVKDDIAQAIVTYDDAVVDAQIQWWEKTPFRDAPGGLAQMKIPDMENVLGGVRYNPPDMLMVTARATVDGEVLMSETLPITIER